MAIHIPKGEGIKIIKQYSEATTNDSIYILPIDGKYAEMIIVDKVGGKRKVGFSLPENLALHDIVNSDGEITTQGNTYLKTQIDTLLNIERTSREGKDAELEMKIQSETRARESKDNDLKTAIETEQQERIAKDAEINETISAINNELNSEKTTREQADISLDGKIDNLKSIVESLSDWKNLMVNEDADAIINTITEVVSAFRNLPEGSNVLELLNAKVNISSIVNNLESEIENVPLSAKQGKILKDLINDTKALLEQTNTTQDTAIASKLDKTTTTIIEPNENFKYAYLTNEANETRRMLAGDLGKNVANSKPTSVAGAGLNMGAIWDIETNGFPLRIKGLANKKSDPTHNLKVKMNADGQMSVSDEADVVFQMPQNATITVNHLYPPQIPERPSYADAIIEAFERAKSKTWTIWGKSDINIIDNNKPIDDFVTFSDNGYLIIRTNNLSENIQKVKLFSSKKFSDADSFQVRMDVIVLEDSAYHGGNIHTGLGYPMLEDIRANASTGKYNSFFELGDDTRTDSTIFFTKVNDIIYITGYRRAGSYSKVVNTSPELGEMVFKILINKGSSGIVRLSYKDLNN